MLGVSPLLGIRAGLQKMRPGEEGWGLHEQARSLSLGFSETLIERPKGEECQELTRCTAVSLNAQILSTLASVLISKSEGRRNLNKENLKKISW